MKQWNWCEENTDAQVTFDLSQNYPNPFNPSTTIRFSIPEEGNVQLILFDIMGRECARLYNGYAKKGLHTINIDATNLSSGTYVLKLHYKGLTQIQTISVLK